MTSNDIADKADEKNTSGDWSGALELCMSSLTDNPEDLRTRLLLSKLLFERGYLPFALAELKKISKQDPDNIIIQNLIHELDPDSGRVDVSQAGEVEATPEIEVVAESDFSLDALSEVKDKRS